MKFKILTNGLFYRYDQICYPYLKGKKWFFIVVLLSSRQALKKYVQSNNDIKTANFDSLFNTALRKGVETGDFLQPKGPSGPVKLAKKEKPGFICCCWKSCQESYY
uniref:Histone H1 n=1 Tax=Candida albicans TaxID=5476 RepID=Q3MP38_CANAX|nr:hypothetical protein [Candida albicans]